MRREFAEKHIDNGPGPCFGLDFLCLLFESGSVLIPCPGLREMEPEEGIRAGGIQLEAFAEVGGGFIPLAEREFGAATTEIRIGILRFDADSFVIVLESAGGLPGFQRGVATGIISIGERVKADAFVKIGERFFRIASGAVDAAAIAEKARVRLERDRLRIVFDGAIVPAFSGVGIGAISERGEIAVAKLQCLSEIFNSEAVLAVIGKRAGPTVIGFGIIGAFTDGLIELLDGAFGFTASS